MSKVLILFAHPALEKSRVHLQMLRQLRRVDGVHLHDLYESYPDFDIDVKKEQQLLLAHDTIILQHPFYWYSAPAIIKQWLDLVLEHNWAYGPTGDQLKGKRFMNIISCGGSREAYSQAGRNRFSIPNLLAPFDQTARLCKMEYLPPFAVHGTHKLADGDIREHAADYVELIKALQKDQFNSEHFEAVEYSNDLITNNKEIQLANGS